MNDFDENFLNFMGTLEESPIFEEEIKQEVFQYTTRSYLCESDIKKIPNVIKINTNKISKYITELIFTTTEELTENIKKEYGLRRSYKLLGVLTNYFLS